MSLLVLTITVLPVQSRKLLFFFFSFISLFFWYYNFCLCTTISRKLREKNIWLLWAVFDRPPRPPPLSGSFLPIIKLINIVNLWDYCFSGQQFKQSLSWLCWSWLLNQFHYEPIIYSIVNCNFFITWHHCNLYM